MIEVICVDLYSDGKKQAFLKKFSNERDMKSFLYIWRELAERYNGESFACANLITYPNGNITASLFWRDNYKDLLQGHDDDTR